MLDWRALQEALYPFEDLVALLVKSSSVCLWYVVVLVDGESSEVLWWDLFFVRVSCGENKRREQIASRLPGETGFLLLATFL